MDGSFPPRCAKLTGLAESARKKVLATQPPNRNIVVCYNLTVNNVHACCSETKNEIYDKKNCH